MSGRRVLREDRPSSCHPERSEGSWSRPRRALPSAPEILRCAQDDIRRWAFTVLLVATGAAAASSARAQTVASAAGTLARTRALIDAGQAEQAARAARAARAATAEGLALVALGRRDEARAAFTRALAERAADSLTARTALALLRDARGDRDGAREEFERVLDAAPRTSDDWLALGEAERALGRTEPQRFQDALRAFDQAATLAPGEAEPRLRAAELFLEKYDAVQARPAFEQVLETHPGHPRALLGLARIRASEGVPGAEALVDSALRANPRLVDGHLFVAAARLDAEDLDAADAAIGRALAADSGSLEALSMQAATRWLRGDQRGFDAVRRRVLAADPRHGALYATLAERAARQRRYADAARLAAEGVALDSSSWRSHAVRGINQLRLGFPDSARASLETAFAGDPFDLWTKNTLDLLDATAGYRTVRTAHVDVVADSSESALLALYVGPLLEDGWQRMAARYGYRPPTRVRLELYQRHADFSVRSVGLTGLGALGVSFGPVLAMDSPAAREAGEFHWGSTAWHELAHTFTLGASNDRVPRWLTEGLSVLEERRARPGWGDGPTPRWLAAWKAGRVPPPSRLNDGFVRPAYPEQVVHAYYTASLLCEMLERDGGAGATVALLGAYRDGASTPDALRRALRLTPDELDRRFDAYVRERFATALPAVDERGGALAAVMARGDSLADAGQTAPAIAAFETARALFPEWATGESPYWRLAQLHRARGDDARAAEVLTALVSRNAGHLPALLLLADLRERAGDAAGAADALDASLWIAPYDPAVHARLATLAARLGDHARAVRERRAIVALAPVDVADARFRLAEALLAAGEPAAAKRELLEALERAPGFAPAQELLLRIVDGARVTTGGTR